MACPGSRLLLNFYLATPGSGQVAYQYTCSEELSTNSICVSDTSNTASFTSSGLWGNTNYLDCGSNGALNSFQLKYVVGNHFRYDIRCCKPATTSQVECSDHYTDLQGAGNWQVVFLNSHFLSCPKDTVMSFFHLETSGSSLRYQCNCCQIIDSHP